MPITRLPEAPGHLSAAARAWWAQVVEAYQLESHHVRLLQLAAEAWDSKEEARERVARDGAVFIDRFGQPRQHPSVRIEERASMRFTRLVRELDLEAEVHPGYRRR